MLRTALFANAASAHSVEEKLAQQVFLEDGVVEQERVIIAVASHDMLDSFLLEDPSLLFYNTYISDAYVKFLESAGARVVPLIYGQHDQGDIEDILDNVNGVILPGGAGDDTYELWEKMIYDRVIQLNDWGIYMPIWGICLGFQHLAEYMAVWNPIQEHELKGTNMPLTFAIDDIRDSKFFADIEDYYFSQEDFENNHVFFHQHNYGVPPEEFETDENLKAMVNVIATDIDVDGNEFVTMYEGKDYPIFGTMIHPEKAVASMSKFNNFDHSNEGVQLNRYFADWFVRECKKNDNRYSYYSHEVEALIGNYDFFNTDTYYGGIYLFE